MKLTKSMLKNIILNEIKSHSGQISEESWTMEPWSLDKMGPPGPAFSAAVQKCKEDWMSMQSDEDPSMRGSDVPWSEQVEYAVEDLAQKIAETYADVEDMLIDGRYA